MLRVSALFEKEKAGILMALLRHKNPGKFTYDILLKTLVTPPERGDDHANYIDLSHSQLDCDDQSKKQKPPLGQVTVSSA